MYEWVLGFFYQLRYHKCCTATETSVCAEKLNPTVKWDNKNEYFNCS